MADEASPDAAVVEVRPPKLPAQMGLFVAVGSAFLAVGGLATGQVLLGLVALVSAAWLASMTYVSLTAWARADGDGASAHWVRTTQSLSWDEVDEVRIDRRGPNGTLRGVFLVRADGTGARWAPWFPFLSHTYHSVSVSLDGLTACAEAQGVPVRVLSPSPRPEPQR